MLLSPIINKWLEVVSLKNLQNYLIAFYLFAFLFAWLFNNPYLGFNRGSSVIAFVGFYCLGYYLRLLMKESKLEKNKYFYLILALAIAVFSSLLITVYIFYSKSDFSFEDPVCIRWQAYISPLVILYAVLLFIFFTKIKIQSQFINWLSASSFSVYLIHRNEDIYDLYFKGFLRWLDSQFELPLFLFYTFIFVIALFMACVLIDQIRIYIWNRVWSLSQKLIYK